MSEAMQTVLKPPVTGWVLTHFHGVAVAFRQAEVRKIETLAALQPSVNQDFVADFYQDGFVWPVYGLDPQLSLRTPMASDRFIVFIEALHQPMGLLVEAAQILPNDADLALQPLPNAMRVPGLPYEQLAVVNEEKVALVTEAQALACYLEKLAPARSLQ